MATVFCNSCLNLMEPREDVARKCLVFYCKGCAVSQDADSPIVFRQDIVKSVSDQLSKIPDDIITDPALERSRVVCPQCANGTAVRITPPVAASDNRIKIIFVCTNPTCIHKWQR